MAAVAAGPVFRLLGVRDLGTATDDYNAEKKPPVNVSLLDGHLAWRQHDGGHTDGPNFKYFIPWASALLGHTPPADQALMRRDRNSQLAHADLLAKAKDGRVDLYFQGDSITRRWGATDYPELLEHWRESFHGWNAANFAWGGDSTQNILWRITDGELEGLSPKAIVLLAGTNNIGAIPVPQRSTAHAPEIAGGVEAIVQAMQAKAPAAAVVLTGVFPRNDGGAATLELVDAINEQLAAFAGRSERVRYLDINAQLADSRGMLDERMSGDGLHLNERGYEVWADALKPVLTELLGPRAREDFAPAPTGDPRAAGRVD
jgi:lysophospholipase L1-like esterase